MVELEKLLREEIKLRDKAERKLRFLKKKVESFNRSSKSGQLGHSDSSEKCENSSGSSSISSDSKYSEASETKHSTKNSTFPENVVLHNHSHNVSEYTTKDCDSQITDSSSSNSNPGYSSSSSSPQILSQNPNPNSESEDLKNGTESRY